MSYEIGPVDGWSITNIGPLVDEADGTQSRTLTVVRGTPSGLDHRAFSLCENAAGEPGFGGGYMTGGLPAIYNTSARSTPDHPILKGIELVSTDPAGSGATAEGNVFLRYWFDAPGAPGQLTRTFDPVTGATTFSGLTPGSTLTRTDPVYGPVPIPVDDAGVAVDTWPPLNEDVEYLVTEPDGTTTTTIVVDTTVEGPDGPGSDPLPRLSVPSQPALELPPVTLIEYTGAYPARNTVHDILDRTDPVVVQREPGLRRGELTYLFDDHAAAMQIADAYRTGAKISLRQATHDRLDVVHIATGDVQITPEHGGLAWRLRVAYTEVAP